MKLVTVLEMRKIEKEADQNGLSFDQMMENAGNGLGLLINDRYSGKKPGPISGLVGSGNNGGDTLIALKYLLAQGWDATAYLVKTRPKKDPLLVAFVAEGGKIFKAEEDPGFDELLSVLGNSVILLDGILGTGFELPLKTDISQILRVIQSWIQNNSHSILIIAVDCPSGMDCDTGEFAEETLCADVTMCMAAIKTGLVSYPGFARVGELNIVDIGLSDDLPAWKKVSRFVADQEYVKTVLPKRDIWAHKGTFGTSMIAAGSVNYTGAALLAGRAAYRIGSGLVTLAVPGIVHLVLSGQFPEATWLILPEESGVIAVNGATVLLGNLDRVSALLLGPGWGQEDTTFRFMKALLINGPGANVKTGIGFVNPQNKDTSHPLIKLPPLVVDADGLKLLAKIPGWYKLITNPAVLTPHPGEMAILTGKPIDEIQSNRLEMAEKYAAEWGQVVVLKGALTIVAGPDGKTAVIPVATPALARAGTGDVLAGIITGLRAQDIEAFQAAVAGAWIHSQAGLAAAKRLGTVTSVLAGDVVQEISCILASIGA
jgi:ADP-dependent NAD(P)H-hydrate dehydratase / NAD(P)H-hydrate epimerase